MTDLSTHVADCDGPASGFLASIRSLVKLIRLKHWIKNGFVFVPVVFAGALLNIGVTHLLTVGLGENGVLALQESTIFIDTY